MTNDGPLTTIQRSIFRANAAVVEGLAVMNTGSIGSMSDVILDGNTFYCPEGSYGYDEGHEAEEVMLFATFELVY